MDITDIKGIGPEKAKKLAEYGIKTAEQVATLNVAELCSYLGITWKQAKAIIDDAKEKLLENVVVAESIEDIKKRERELIFIPTGSVALDNLLGGGVRTDAITAVIGEFSVGKTQLAYQLTVSAMKMGYGTVWIETEPSIFSTKRLEEVATGNKVTLDPKLFYLIPARTIATVNHQFMAYERAEKIFESNPAFKLLIIDSFVAKFRAEFGSREMFPERSREFARHLAYLNYIASKHNAAVFVTSQVAGLPLSDQEQLKAMGLPLKLKTGLKGKIIWGGDVPLHGYTFILTLSQVGKEGWKAELIDSPFMPRGEAYFTITAEGIRDYKGGVSHDSG